MTPELLDAHAIQTAGRRQINLIWERSQAGIAFLIVSANVLAAFVTTSPDGRTLLANAFFLVIGFYFGRTNHSRPDSPTATGDR